MPPPAAPQWTVFLDRDGVLNRKKADGDYVKTWSEFAWLPGAREAAARLHSAGARVIIATNQRGVSRGLIHPNNLADIHVRLRSEVEAAGGRIDGVYVCPHREGTCDCRKPAPGLFLQAQRDTPDIDFTRSVVIGDSTRDIEAGRAIGARTVRVGGDGSHDARDLADAVDRIVLPWLRS